MDNVENNQFRYEYPYQKKGDTNRYLLFSASEDASLNRSRAGSAAYGGLLAGRCERSELRSSPVESIFVKCFHRCDFFCAEDGQVKPISRGADSGKAFKVPSSAIGISFFLLRKTLD